jgi:hypothetical protein
LWPGSKPSNGESNSRGFGVEVCCIATEPRRLALSKILPDISQPLKGTAEYRLLKKATDHSIYNIVHLIYLAKEY